MKYIILLTIMAFSFNVIMADDNAMDDPIKFLDSPVPSPTLDINFKFEFNFNALSSVIGAQSTINNILNFFANQDQNDNSGLWNSSTQSWDTHFITEKQTGVFGDFNKFKNDTAEFLSSFPQGSEAFTMALKAGDTAFLNSSGQAVEGTDDVYDQFNNNASTTHQLVYYAGRNTAISEAGAHGGDGVFNYNWWGNKDRSASATFNKDSNTKVKLFTLSTQTDKYEIFGYGTSTPIVLDMNGDGKLEASNGLWLPHRAFPKMYSVAFDINGDGFEEVVEWVGANDAFLVEYESGPMTGLNMFGDAGGFAHGFQKLAVLDTNKDGQLSGAELKGLKVWHDKNRNAKVDTGEIKTLAQHNITSLSVKSNNLRSSFVQNGKMKTMWDWHPVTTHVKKRR